jgi:hypothetical protein
MLLQMVRKQHILLFLKCFKFILPCLWPFECNEKIKYTF